MDSKIKTTVCNSVYRQFPELNGASPQVKEIPGDKYQFIFQGKAKAADGKSLPRTVRVVANQEGKILKMTTSR